MIDWVDHWLDWFRFTLIPTLNLTISNWEKHNMLLIDHHLIMD